MTRILNVLFDERVGGPQLRVLQVARQLRQRGVETHVVIPKGDPQFASMLSEGGIPCHQLDLVRLRQTFRPLPHVRFATQFWPNVCSLTCLIRRHRIQIVHTNGLMHLQAAVAARLGAVPLVWHLNDVETPPLVLPIFPRLVRRWADSVAVAAAAVSRHCFPNGTEPKGWTHVLYAPVDTEKFSPEPGTRVRAEFGIPADTPLVGAVANFSPGKGLEYLLEAAPTIKERYPKAKFLFVGEMLENRRSYWQALLRRREQLGLATDIIFTGRRNDMSEVYRAMTLLVQASEAEACPMAVMEAGASGLPVVATEVGGTPELVEHGLTGLLIAPRNPARIAEAVIDVFSDPGRARRMGLAAAERMRRYFSLDRCVEAHIRLYESVLRRRPFTASAKEAPRETLIHQ